MTKFTDKSVTYMPLAYFYQTMRKFKERIEPVQCQIDRFEAMRDQQLDLFSAFERAYTSSDKSHLTETIRKKDDERDSFAYVIAHQAKLWAEKLTDDRYSIHGRRVWQVLKDFQFRPGEALIAENSKIFNIQQRFADPELSASLEAMGLKDLNARMAELTSEIDQLISLRNEERSAYVPGEVKQTRDALDAHFHQFLTFLNAVQELHPEDSISQAAQFFNADFSMIEQQYQQSRRKSSTTKTDTTAPEAALTEPVAPTTEKTEDSPEENK